MGGGHLSDARLQDLYARALARRGNQSLDCVSPEDLLRLVRREGSEERRLEILDHVMTCPACRKELGLLQAIETAGAAMEERRGNRNWTGRWVPLALAASLFLALGIGVVLRQRAGTTDIERGAGSIVLVAPAGEVPAGEPVGFAWHPLSGARRYRLELLDASNTAVFSEETTDTTLTLPGGRLRARAEYRWWVRDATPGAQRSSPVRRLRVRSQ